jgi:hypothetical protein
MQPSAVAKATKSTPGSTSTCSEHTLLTGAQLRLNTRSCATPPAAAAAAMAGALSGDQSTASQRVHIMLIASCMSVLQLLNMVQLTDNKLIC